MNVLHNILLTAFDYTKIPLTVVSELHELIYTTSETINNQKIKDLTLAEDERTLLFSHTSDNLLYASFFFSFEGTAYYLVIGPHYLFSLKEGTQVLSTEMQLQIKRAIIFFEDWTVFIAKILTNRRQFQLQKRYCNAFITNSIVFDELETAGIETQPDEANVDFLYTQRQIFDFILNGDETNALNSLDQYMSLSQLNFSQNHIQKIKYEIVIFIALLSNLLITEKNISATTIRNMSDLYITEIDGLQTEHELRNFFKAVIIEFSHKAEQLTYYSPHTTKAIQYITNQLYNPICVQDVANHLQLSLSYTSNLFKREVGVSLKKFIQIKRINEAKMLLIYSDYSASQIAEHLQFCSTSYFSKVFTQEIGLTPRQFYKTNTLKK
jgi:AraC-like DNA-binding protein